MIKKLLFLISILTIVCQAQPFGKNADGFRIIKSSYSNSSGENGSTNFYYNNNSVLHKSFWTLEDGSRFSTNYYENDENGNIIATYREFSDSLTSFEMFKYNKDGNKVSEQFSRSDKKNGTAIYNYENGLLKTANYQNHKGWLNGIVKYECDKYNKLISGKFHQDEKEIANITYKYDINGNFVEENWDFSGKWSQKFIYRYENIRILKNYYANPFLQIPHGVRIKEEYYTYNNEKSGPSYYNYNERGLLGIKKFVRSDSTFTITKYKYDENGKLKKSYRQYSDSKNAYFTYFYDENSNLALREFFKNDSLFGYESYFYNSENKLYKAVLKNFDSWLSGEISFQYNPNGQLDKGFFDGKDSFDAKISFIYEEDLLVEILWNFSFGKFQKYTFDYE